MTYQADAATAFNSANSFFRTSQSVMNAKGDWRPGDKFTVSYIDGTIAEFELSTRGMICAFRTCKWASTIPLNDPTVLQSRTSSGSSPNVFVAANAGGSITSAPWYMNLTQTVSFSNYVISVGPLTPSGAGNGGGKCAKFCVYSE